MGKVSHPRYLLFLAVLAIAGLLLSAVLPTAQALVAGFDVAVLAFVLSCIPLWLRGGAEAIRREARRNDAGQVLLLVLTGLISTVVLVALSLLVSDKQGLNLGEISLLVCTLMASWTFTNLILALHYARLYYSPDDRGDHEGLNFPGDGTPDFSDFVNFAFVIGMTCQTADIAITRPAMRRVSTFHGLFAFAFNLGILALTVNVLASAGG